MSRQTDKEALTYDIEEEDFDVEIPARDLEIEQIRPSSIWPLLMCYFVMMIYMTLMMMLPSFLPRRLDLHLETLENSTSTRSIE